jgi:hypothetical protein
MDPRAGGGVQIGGTAPEAMDMRLDNEVLASPVEVTCGPLPETRSRQPSSPIPAIGPAVTTRPVRAPNLRESVWKGPIDLWASDALA